jgi:hypothetical protein
MDPKECKSLYKRDTLMFIAVLFTIAKVRNQPRCPATNDWIKKICYIFIMQYYLARKNEFTSFAGKWMELEIIMLSKMSQAQKDKYRMFLLVWNLHLKIIISLQKENCLGRRGGDSG